MSFLSSSNSSKHPGKLPLYLLSLAAASLLAAGCGTAVDSATVTGSVTGPAFVVGTDAPMASVTSFSVQLTNVFAIDASGKSTPLISGSPTVDFARFNGLQTLLDMNDVPADTYTSVQIVLGPANIGYLNQTSGAPPTIQSEAATLSSSTINMPLASPLVVTQTEPVGLHMDFDLRKSIQVDSKGQITGAVTPTFNVNAVLPTDSGAYA